jgi:hypothetical protein
MSATDEGRTLDVEPIGTIHCGGRYQANADCRIERSRAEELEKGREMTRSYSSGRSYSR